MKSIILTPALLVVLGFLAGELETDEGSRPDIRASYSDGFDDTALPAWHQRINAAGPVLANTGHVATHPTGPWLTCRPSQPVVSLRIKKPFLFVFSGSSPPDRQSRHL